LDKGLGFKGPGDRRERERERERGREVKGFSSFFNFLLSESFPYPSVAKLVYGNYKLVGRAISSNDHSHT
jgi:hypothetical protein